MAAYPLLAEMLNRQIDEKSRSFADLTLHYDISAMLLDDLMRDGEPEAAPLFFSREKRIKDVLQIFLRDPHTGIAHPNLDELLGAVLGEETAGDLHHHPFIGGLFHHHLQQGTADVPGQSGFLEFSVKTLEKLPIQINILQL